MITYVFFGCSVWPLLRCLRLNFFPCREAADQLVPLEVQEFLDPRYVLTKDSIFNSRSNKTYYDHILKKYYLVKLLDPVLYSGSFFLFLLWLDLICNSQGPTGPQGLIGLKGNAGEKVTLQILRSFLTVFGIIVGKPNKTDPILWVCKKRFVFSLDSLS